MNREYIGILETENAELKQENKQLKETLDKYENPKDMTLMMMWCTEKIKDENKKLKDNWNMLKEKVNGGMRIYRNRGYDLVFDIEEIPKEELNDFISYSAFQVMEQLIINIEQGSDNDV